MILYDFMVLKSGEYRLLSTMIYSVWRDRAKHDLRGCD